MCSLHVRMYVYFVYLFVYLWERFGTYSYSYILHKTAIFSNYSAISGISRTSRCLLPMGEHPWVTDSIDCL